LSESRWDFLRCYRFSSLGSLLLFIIDFFYKGLFFPSSMLRVLGPFAKLVQILDRFEQGVFLDSTPFPLTLFFLIGLPLLTIVSFFLDPIVPEPRQPRGAGKCLLSPSTFFFGRTFSFSLPISRLHLFAMFMRFLVSDHFSCQRFAFRWPNLLPPLILPRRTPWHMVPSASWLLFYSPHSDFFFQFPMEHWLLMDSSTHYFLSASALSPPLLCDLLS